MLITTSRHLLSNVRYIACTLAHSSWKMQLWLSGTQGRPTATNIAMLQVLRLLSDKVLTTDVHTFKQADSSSRQILSTQYKQIGMCSEGYWRMAGQRCSFLY